MAARPWSPAGEFSSEYRARVCRDGGAQCRHRHLERGPLGSGLRGWFRAAARRPASETEVRDYREKFFSGDPDRDARGGQEMKPRW
ncbi:entry exclusion protein TrbK [Agrobacterium sp. S2]|nr:entry exclusion protein TrbK [Agrobacterium sp. S2]